MLKTAGNRYIMLVVHTLSLVLLGFGWVKPLLEIDISVNYAGLGLNLFNETRSVLGTLRSLWYSSHYWPWFLIFFFGMVVPVVKSGAIYYLLLAKNPRPVAASFVRSISKWAMADVFAISLFVAFLGAQAMENTKAILHEGFYWFSAYVLVSAAVGMWVSRKVGNG